MRPALRIAATVAAVARLAWLVVANAWLNAGLAGKPVYVGRPLAASLADAVEIYRLAAEHKTPVFSCSQHRFSPGFIGMRKHEEVGDVLGCDVFGGCPREPHRIRTGMVIWRSLSAESISKSILAKAR